MCCLLHWQPSKGLPHFLLAAAALLFARIVRAPHGRPDKNPQPAFGAKKDQAASEKSACLPACAPPPPRRSLWLLSAKLLLPASLCLAALQTAIKPVPSIFIAARTGEEKVLKRPSLFMDPLWHKFITSTRGRRLSRGQQHLKRNLSQRYFFKKRAGL